MGREADIDGATLQLPLCAHFGLRKVLSVCPQADVVYRIDVDDEECKAIGIGLKAIQRSA
jgi:hypothetical protein